MKRLLFFLIFPFFLFNATAQDRGNVAGESATTTAATRLFSDREDLSSVLTIIPKGKEINILGSDDTYYYVEYDNNKGYIYKRHASINAGSAKTSSSSKPAVHTKVQTTAAGSNKPSAAPAASASNRNDRLSTLLSRYDPHTAKSICERKIWKGMNTDMVIDSWGNPKKINREIVSDNIKEEWHYTKSWLYFENDILVNWGPLKK